MQRYPHIMGQFDQLFLSHEIGFRKPGADAFLHVCDLLQTEPQHVTFLDDSQENVAGARAAKITAHHTRSEAEVLGILQRLSTAGQRLLQSSRAINPKASFERNRRTQALAQNLSKKPGARVIQINDRRTSRPNEYTRRSRVYRQACPEAPTRYRCCSRHHNLIGISLIVLMGQSCVFLKHRQHFVRRA